MIDGIKQKKKKVERESLYHHADESSNAEWIYLIYNI